MSVRDRILSDVGDTDPVWRYLLEKVAHTALIAWALHVAAGEPAVAAAWYAMAAYLVIGKALWLYGAHKAGLRVDTWFEIRDSIFDGLVGGIVITLALGAWVNLLVSAALIALLVALFNNRWSSPGNLG